MRRVRDLEAAHDDLALALHYEPANADAHFLLGSLHREQSLALQRLADFVIDMRKLLLAASLVYVFTALSIGLLISTVAKRQQHAMFMALGATLMPSVILSGFIFPVESMPFALQAVSALIPATYFLEIVRGIILKGVGLAELWQPLGILALEGVILMAASIRKFKVKL